MDGSRTLHHEAEGAARYAPVLDHPWYRTAATGLAALLAAAAAYLAARGDLQQAVAVAALAALGIGFLAVRDRLPSLFSLLFLIFAAINLAGYLFDLWKRPIWFDEVVHAGTSFAIMAAIGWVLLGRSSLTADGYAIRFTAAVAAIGLGLGLAWEAFEWLIGIIGDRRDTLMDLVMDCVGAVAAGLFCSWAVGENREHAGV